MGNRREEDALAKYLPAAFKTACPHCKTPGTVHRVERSVQIECVSCGQDQINRGDAAHWFANSGAYVKDDEWAWRKLWRSFVMRFGLNAALAKTGAV